MNPRACDSDELWMRFLERVILLPLGEWLDASLSEEARRAATVRPALARALAEQGEIFRAWRVRDGVTTVICLFEARNGVRALRRSETRDRVRAATEDAALALLARSWLSDAALREIYAPFEARIPFASIASEVATETASPSVLHLVPSRQRLSRQPSP
jgi:hypothetical protein